jgi:hypothetical protein
LNWFQERENERGGGNYQTMMNEALRAYTHSKDKILEETLRSRFGKVPLRANSKILAGRLSGSKGH